MARKKKEEQSSQPVAMITSPDWDGAPMESGAQDGKSPSEQVDESLVEVAPRTVRMTRDEPMSPDGPTTADVHPDEVANYEAGGWFVEA